MSNGFVKTLLLPSIDSRGERRVAIASTDAKATSVKIAAGDGWSPATRDFIANVKPKKGKVIILINALGAGEYYGPNINGDHFPEEALKKYHSTFKNAKLYLHHQNKDPKKSYGDVLFSDFNDVMKRVEIVVEADSAKLGKKYIDKVNNGDLVHVSMGCRVPFDVCNLCNHVAKTPADYCRCLKDRPGLGKMLPDGRKAYAINTKPDFFDISFVTIPADQTARVLLKLASAGAPDAEEPEASESSSGDVAVSKQAMLGLENLFESLTDRFNSSMGPDLPFDLLDGMATSGLGLMPLLKGFLKRSIMLRPPEMQRIILVSSGRKPLADAMDKAKILIGGAPSEKIEKLIESSPEDSHCFHNMPEEVSCRAMTPKNIKIIIIKMMAGEHTKQAGIIDTPMSDSYRLLNGEQLAASGHGMFDDPVGTVKMLATVGAIIATMGKLMGKNILENISPEMALAGLAMSAHLNHVTKSTIEQANAPTQQMIMPNDIRHLLGAQKFGSVKLADMVGSFMSGSLRPMLALPLAYGASELIARKAKEHAIEDAQETGEYKPSWLDNPSRNMLFTLPLVMKFASARRRVAEYVKTSEAKLGRSFDKIYSESPQQVLSSLYEMLFRA